MARATGASPQLPDEAARDDGLTSRAQVGNTVQARGTEGREGLKRAERAQHRGERTHVEHEYSVGCWRGE